MSVFRPERPPRAKPVRGWLPAVKETGAVWISAGLAGSVPMLSMASWCTVRLAEPPVPGITSPTTVPVSRLSRRNGFSVTRFSGMKPSSVGGRSGEIPKESPMSPGVTAKSPPELPGAPPAPGPAAGTMPLASKAAAIASRGISTSPVKMVGTGFCSVGAASAFSRMIVSPLRWTMTRSLPWTLIVSSDTSAGRR